AAASRYAEAIALLHKERTRIAGADWSSAVDQKLLQIRQNADLAFAPLRQKALQARRNGAENEVRVVVDQVRSWGLEDLSAELASALEAIPPLARPPDPETRAFQEAWDNALGLARARDYAGAVRELEAACQALRNPAAKADAAADLDLLRLLGAAYADIL